MGSAYTLIVEASRRRELCPVISVPLVAYLARYPATMLSVTGLVPCMAMARTSSSAPQVISQPPGWPGWGDVL